MVARNIIAVLLLLAFIGHRVDCQLENAESQNRLCPALYGERNLRSFLYLSDIVFYGKVLETYQGTVPGTLVAKVRYFLYYKGKLPRPKSFTKRFIFVENFSDGSHTCLPQVKNRQAMLFFVSILSGRYVINALESTARTLDHLDLIVEVSRAENKRILEFTPPLVDPCRSREANNCSESALCDTVNPQPGLAYRCVCNIGYYGNGFRCEAVATVMNESRNIPKLPELPNAFFSSSVTQEPTSDVYSVFSSIDRTSEIHPVSSSINRTSEIHPVSSSIDRTSEMHPVSSSIDRTSEIHPVSSSIDRTSEIHPVSSSISPTLSLFLSTTSFFDQSTSKKLSVVDTQFIQSTVLATPTASSPATPSIPPPLLTPSPWPGSGFSGFSEDDVAIARDQEMDDV